MRKIQTIESDRYEKTEKGLLRHVGMISGQELFDKLKKHLEENDLLPDEYFLQSIYLNQTSEVPNFSDAVCHTNWGGSEGIYIDIDLAYREGDQRKFFHLATGKTLDQDGDAFMRMSRIAAECSMMLNGRGEIVKISDKYYMGKGTEQDKAALAEQIQSAASRAAKDSSSNDVKLQDPTRS